MSYRHGDVILLDAVPLPAVARRQDTDIVARGEVTGHAHRLVGGELWEDGNGGLAIVASDDAALLHEEHARLPLARTKPGTAYPVIIQREYDDEKEWRQVGD